MPKVKMYCPIHHIKNFLILFLFACTPSTHLHADTKGGRGVFAVEKDPSQIVGTAFLIDKQEGLLLTAAHVLSDCNTKTHEGPYKIRWALTTSLGGMPKFYNATVECEAVAWGYDFVNIEVGKGTVRDWAMLRILNKEDRDLMKLFTVFKIDLRQTPQTLIDLSPREVIIAGFPRGIDDTREIPSRLNPRPKPSGLWSTFGRVDGGNSGGPCFIPAKRHDVLCGIVLKKDDLNNLIVPAYSFADDLAKNAPKSENLNTVIRFLRQDPDEKNQSIEQDMVLALLQLSGFEHWQLRHILCTDQSIPTANVTTFVFGFYTDHASPIFLLGLFTCRHDMAKHGSIQVDLISTKIRQNGFSNVSANTLLLAYTAADTIADYWLNPELLEDAQKTPSEVSRNLTDFIYLESIVKGAGARRDKQQAAFAFANKLYQANPNIPSSAALAFADELNNEQKMVLTRSSVEFLGVREVQGATNTASVIVEFKPIDTFLYEQFWNSKGNTGRIKSTNGNTLPFTSIPESIRESLILKSDVTQEKEIANLLESIESQQLW